MTKHPLFPSPFLVLVVVICALCLGSFAGPAFEVSAAGREAPAAGAGQAAAPSAGPPRTYTNPLSIPDYPVGKRVRGIANGTPVDDSNLWRVDRTEQFRELADPSVLWHEGKWYLYPSVDMAWVSADMGATWQHHPLNIRDIGYAPTIVKHRGRFLLMASESSVYESDSPLGPFKELGPITIPNAAALPTQIDPMLFSDDDGRLYYYWGCTPSRGIFAVELDAANPTRVIGEPKEVIPFSPDVYPWERVGNWNQDVNVGWVEGSWMLKRDGRYILVYSAGGTQHRTYAMGAYTSRSLLGPFEPQKRNPFFRTTTGLVTGTSHGAVAEGPGGRVWAFYTVFAGAIHGFERRVGMDVVEVDAQGELHVPSATVTPQWLPGRGPGGTGPSDTGWIPLNADVQTLGSTDAPNLRGRFAVDEDLRTWWQPADGDAQPTLTTHLLSAATINAVRVAWRDVGLDATRGIPPGPFRYRIELETAPGTWTTVIDRTANTDDLLLDYRECAPTVATRARLVITAWPKGIRPGVAEFTVFGETVRARPRNS